MGDNPTLSDPIMYVSGTPVGNQAGFSGSGSGIGGSSVVGAVISGIFSLITNLSSAKLQQKYQKQLMNLQSELNEAQAQRDYARYMEAQETLMRLQYQLQSLSSQTAQARSANLNVGAMFSNGPVGSSVSTASSPPSGSGVGLGAAPSDAFGSPLTAAQTALTLAQAKKVDAETPDEGLMSQSILADIAAKLAASHDSEASASMLRFNLSFSEAAATTNLETLKAEYRNVLKQGSIMDASLLNSKLDAQQKVIGLGTSILDRYLLYLKIQAESVGIRLTQSQISETMARTKQALASAANARADVAEKFLNLYRSMEEAPSRNQRQLSSFLDSMVGSGTAAGLLRAPLGILFSAFTKGPDANQKDQENALRRSLESFFHSM